MSLRVKVLQTATELELSLTQHIATTANVAIGDRGRFSIVITGGKTVLPIYRGLRQIQTDWSKWSITWSDERCVPTEHPERNSKQAYDEWLSHVPIPRENILPIPAELGAAAGSIVYSQTAAPQCRFDIVVLTLGNDGHVASIFPSQKTLPKNTDIAIPVFDAPTHPAERISLSLARLADTQQLILLAVGKQKTAALNSLINTDTSPVALLTQHCCVTIWTTTETI